MNRTLFTLLLAVCSIAATAQYQYVPMPLDKGQWRYRISSSMSTTQVNVEDYMLMGTAADTVIFGKTYKQIKTRSRQQITYKPIVLPIQSVAADLPDEANKFIREDSQKVYRYIPSNGTEVLIYDFTRSVGQTLPTVFNYYPVSGSFDYQIKAIDTINIGGTLRKRFIAVENLNAQDTIVVIEGIGSSRGLTMNNKSGIYGQYELTMEFHCFTEPAAGIEYNPNNFPCTYVWNISTPVSVNNMPHNTKISIYPNPVVRDLSIKTTENATATVYNNTGSVVLRQALLEGHNNIEAANFAPGIYFISLQSETGKVIYAGKLVKE